jgi:hypothetical protein
MHACRACIFCRSSSYHHSLLHICTEKLQTNQKTNKCRMHACFVVCLHHVQLSSCHIRCCTFAPTNMLYRHQQMIMCKCLSMSSQNHSSHYICTRRTGTKHLTPLNARSRWLSCTEGRRCRLTTSLTLQRCDRNPKPEPKKGLGLNPKLQVTFD